MWTALSAGCLAGRGLHDLETGSKICVIVEVLTRNSVVLLSKWAGIPLVEGDTPHALTRRMTNNSSFRDLKVWRDAMTLVEDIYKLSKRFPADERFGLTAQLRRAAVSIPSNIGEGKRRKRQRASQPPGYRVRITRRG